MAKKKTRILIIENAIDVTGSVTSIMRSSEYLRRDYDFIFILPTGSKATMFIQANGFETHFLAMKEIRKTFLSILFYLPALLINTLRFRRLVRSVKADLILNNDFYNLLPPFYRLFGGKVPYLCYVRFLPARFPRILVNTWCSLHDQFSAGVIAVSNAVRDQLPALKHLLLIGNELPLKPVSFNLTNSKIILYPSNFMEGKGHNEALASFEAIAGKFPEWRLRFIGGDMGLKKNAAYRSALMRKVDASSARDQMECYDFAADLSPHFNACAFVLIFSRSESFSMTCLEAMYHGRPVVATKSGGPQEIIDHNVNGILVGIESIKEMSSAIEWLITESGQRAIMSERAYHHVREKFSISNTIEKLRDLYDASLKQMK
ncbi:MAG: glycosyltransferase family 4 protein [Chryseolinea sp.]